MPLTSWRLSASSTEAVKGERETVGSGSQTFANYHIRMLPKNAVDGQIPPHLGSGGRLLQTRTSVTRVQRLGPP